MKRRNSVIAWLVLMILLNGASLGVVTWQQSRQREAFSAYRLATDIEKYLLECRRQEKNFFIRTSMDAIQTYMANHDSAAMQISRLMEHELPADVRMKCSILSELLGNYVRAFKATSIYRRDNPMGNDMVSMMHMCTEIARKCHSETASILADSEQRYQMVSRMAARMARILLILTPLVSILIAVLVVRQVATLGEQGGT